ncbi:hypothetical protein V5O48_014513 [Marasmius crinis-equi]|uniref:Uncharacterized protein n=1 Tax=Marasmius crinis-equi TaxID=585013 RepID=A0ABR3EX22_9AGAR
MYYQNPLHAPVQPSQVSSYSSLGGAVTYQQPTASAFGVNSSSVTRQRVPQTHYAPTGKWKQETGRVQPLNNPIDFDYIGIPKQGMPLRELCARGPHAINQMMQGANDQIMFPSGSKITFHIRWPGYEHIEYFRTIETVTSQGKITRGQLAGIIAQNFSRYFEKVQYEATRDVRWRIGPSGIKFEHIILLSLVNVFDNAWQAEVAVNFRS